MAKVSRAGFDARKMKSKDLKGDRARLTATLYEAMRKTAGERATEKYALENPAINPARTAENWDFVYDEATGDFREATSIEEVVDYAMSRRARLSKPVKGAPLDEAPDSMEGNGEVFAETFVIPVPWDLLEPIPGEYYHPLHRVTGLPLDGQDGRPLVRNQRFRIKEVKKEAFEAFKAAALDQIGKTLPGGKEAIFGGSLNLDEMRPHLQVIGDTFYATPTKRDPRALSNGFTKAFGRYPRYDVTVPEYRYHKRDAAGELMYGKDGSPVYASIGPSRKMELHQRNFRERMHELGKQLEHDLGEGKGFHVEKGVDEQRHLRRLSAEDYKEVAQAQEAHDEDLLEFAEATQVLDDETEARAIELSEAEAVARLERRADQRAFDERKAAELGEVRQFREKSHTEVEELKTRTRTRAGEIVAHAERRAARITDKAQADADTLLANAQDTVDASVAKEIARWEREDRPGLVKKAEDEGRAKIATDLAAAAQARADAEAEKLAAQSTQAAAEAHEREAAQARERAERDAKTAADRMAKANQMWDAARESQTKSRQLLDELERAHEQRFSPEIAAENMNAQLVMMLRNTKINVYDKDGNPVPTSMWDAAVDKTEAKWAKTQAGKVPTKTYGDRLREQAATDESAKAELNRLAAAQEALSQDKVKDTGLGVGD
ncbi:MAG TPA: hypothetical protein PK331_13025 [Gordonia sp. (in: high G+C Gram-positive bacteria)]|uniref:hypothetical protein n=1 Tax=Gordonia sp. (in: high G+C Gram-positive bacteria) TaxID=84139 RepID=UPI002CAC87A2|nr:hypothetical protein [Gordonia sp. (in: high G+C Gram-positive bacteria)]HNP55888.1 hypothetical protein [Gordonia sp. (in: high G+C Gram-positive bacteria)]HRC51829.1 hypothetical protein [Gordonia sp. (in: high G+C Gram-positive bacteria)]